jgi:hypothetical protein
MASMFEPLAKMFDKHAAKANATLVGVLGLLDQIVTNTEGKMEFDQFGTYGESGKLEPLEVTNNEGCYWEVTATGVTGTKAQNVAIHVGTDGPESLVNVIPLVAIKGGFGGGSGRKFIVPPRATVFVQGEETGTVNLQVRRLVENVQYDETRSRSYDITANDLHMADPERHRPPRAYKGDDEVRELHGVRY